MPAQIPLVLALGSDAVRLARDTDDVRMKLGTDPVRGRWMWSVGGRSTEDGRGSDPVVMDDALAGWSAGDAVSLT